MLNGNTEEVPQEVVKHKLVVDQKVVLVNKDGFECDNHFYPKTINAQVSEIVLDFMNLGNSRVLKRFLHLNPQIDEKQLHDVLSYKPKFFYWSGADLFNATNPQGLRKMVLIETNSCPSGQKSMPVLNQHDDHGGYRTLIEKTFKPMLEEHEKQLDLKVKDGKLAVLYDKNKMEASGYAATLADVFGEPVYLVEYYDSDKEPSVRFVENEQVMQIKDNDDNWVNIRGCFRYVTQKPWDRFPLSKIRTCILNPVVCCLAGGRNKLLAAKAYDFLNSQYSGYGIRLNCPRTIRDVEKKIIPIWVESFGGYAVIKNPYSNAGQGVWTIVSQKELDEFMNSDTGGYDQYIVQSLIGNSKWSSITHQGQLYHVGTVPDSKRNIYVADLRMMIHYDFQKGAFAPLALYARRAKSPLTDDIEGKDSWDILGTNLSIKLNDGKWDTDQKRLIICDRKDFAKLGLGVDNLIDAFIQTVLATVAIDKLAARLISENGTFDRDLFYSLNKDEVLLNELSHIGDKEEK